MGRYPTKAAGNRYYESRKNAAEHDERLTSREAAGELLGVSWSSLADYERGSRRSRWMWFAGWLTSTKTPPC